VFSRRASIPTPIPCLDKRLKREDLHRATQEVHSKGSRLRDIILNSPVVTEVHPANHNNNSIPDNKAAVHQRTNNHHNSSVNLDAQCSPEVMYHILKRSKDSNGVLCRPSTVDRVRRNNKEVDILLAKVVHHMTGNPEDTRTADQNKVARVNSSSNNNNSALLRINNRNIQIPGRILELWVICN
jgi:hypothetical protein